MYNMDISIFGYKLNLEILILIGVIYLILVGHTLCGCCNYSLMEGLDNMTKPATDMPSTMSSDNTSTTNSIPAPAPAGDMVGKPKDKSVKTNDNSVGKESFVGANTNYGQSSPFDLNNNSSINTSSWNAQDMTVIPGKPLSPGVRQILDREPQPIPLPEGELLMFANTPFKPECCPNTYSTSTGCACMTTGQYNYLVTRGGNNVPYSEY